MLKPLNLKPLNLRPLNPKPPKPPKPCLNPVTAGTLAHVSEDVFSLQRAAWDWTASEILEPHVLQEMGA